MTGQSALGRGSPQQEPGFSGELQEYPSVTGLEKVLAKGLLLHTCL